MQFEPQDYVTVIGYSYIYPISELLKKLQAHTNKGVNEVQTSAIENGFSVSTIVLIALYIESLTVRIRFEKNALADRKALIFLKNFVTDQMLYDQIVELFVIRDTIAHNHLWKAKFQFIDEQNEMKLLESELDENFGDKKFNRLINFKLRKTKILSLNLFTTRINYNDVQKTVKLLFRFMDYLKKNDFKHLDSFKKVIDKEGLTFGTLLKKASAT